MCLDNHELEDAKDAVFDAAMAARDALRLASSYLSDPEPQSNELIWRLLDALREAEEEER